MALLDSLFIYLAAFLITSFALGLIFRGPDGGKKIVAWELKKLIQFGRWTLKHVFRSLAWFFHGLAKKCEHKKKKTP